MLATMHRSSMGRISNMSLISSSAVVAEKTCRLLMFFSYQNCLSLNLGFGMKGPTSTYNTIGQPI